MKNVMILGGRGNMGRRYGCILKSLGVNVTPIDVSDGSTTNVFQAGSDCDGIIIATPTPMHVVDIVFCSQFEKPILVEKPISVHMSLVEAALRSCEKKRAPIQMINQYKKLISDHDSGESVYDYWNHGRDGLAWDCISVVALAKGPIRLAETSPVWNCKINGRVLDQSKMDSAYVGMIAEWIQNPVSDPAYIIEAHEKVHQYLENNRE